MKLIEKFAKEAADQHCGYEMNDQINVLAQMAFRSGFRKARELAAEFMKRKTQHDSLFVPGYIDQLLINLGEEEL